jgi:hypothetical protein
VGFAAESHDLLQHAMAKRLRKDVPLLVGNIGPATFGRTTTPCCWWMPGHRELPRAPKTELGCNWCRSWRAAWPLLRGAERVPPLLTCLKIAHHTSNYDGPRGGDYVRYVDSLLRASPLYRSAFHGLNAGNRSDFTDAGATPGAQPASALARVREKAQAAVQQAQEAQRAGRPAAQKAQQRKARNPRKQLEAEQAARRAAQQQAQDKPAAASWFRITPGRIVFRVPGHPQHGDSGLGALLLLFGIVSAVRKGIRSAAKD